MTFNSFSMQAIPAHANQNVLGKPGAFSGYITCFPEA